MIQPCAFAGIVSELISVTEHHDRPETTDQKLMIDIDLSPLGKTWKLFCKDNCRIRAEYVDTGAVTADSFDRGRPAFLREFLTRLRIFQSPEFFQLYEVIARENIQRLLAQHAG